LIEYEISEQVSGANGGGQRWFADSDGQRPPPWLTFALGGIA